MSPGDKHPVAAPDSLPPPELADMAQRPDRAGERDTQRLWRAAREFFGSRHWTLTQKFVAGVVAAIGLVTGVVSIVPILFADSSSFDSLELIVVPEDNAPIEYAVPAAELAAFVASVGECGDRERAWLSEHGVPLDRTVLVRLGNTAAEGPMASLTEFRLRGERGRTGTAVRVVCEPSEARRVTARTARFDTDDPSAEAVYEVSEKGSVGGVPSIAVARNLAPGETEQLLFEVFGTSDFTGTLTATAGVRGEQREVEIKGAEVEVPGLIRAGAEYVLIGPQGAACRRSGVEGGDCELGDLVPAAG